MAGQPIKRARERAKLSAVEAQLARWRGEPISFVREVLGAEPAGWQGDTLRALVTDDRIAVRSGHGVGKSTLLSWVALWRSVCFYRAKTIITANSQPQLKDVIWPEIQQWLGALPKGLRDEFEVTAEKLFRKKDPENNFTTIRTARKEVPEALQGFHSDHQLVVVDEASGVDEAIFQLLNGAMTGSDAKMLLAGNPTRLNNYFYHAFHKNRDHWWTRRVSTLEVFEEGHKWAGGGKKVAETYAREYGEESDVYAVRVLGDFPGGEEKAVIPLKWVEDALERDVDGTGDVIWGLDVARFGDDRTALAKRRGNVLLEPVQSWRHKDTMQVAALVGQEWDACHVSDRPIWICVDSVGVGAGVVDRLREDGFPVKEVNAGESATDDRKFMRRRDELWWEGRRWFQAQDCKIPDDEQLIEELTTVMYDYTSTHKVKVEGKSELKERRLKSPDLADAFLATFGARSRPRKRKSSFAMKALQRKWPVGKFRGREIGIQP